MGRKANLKRVKRIAKMLPDVNRLDHQKNMRVQYDKNGASGVQAYVDYVLESVDNIINAITNG